MATQEQGQEVKVLWTESAVVSYFKDPKNKLDSDILADIITSNEDRRNLLQTLYQEYKGHVPIDDKVSLEGRPNNKLPNDFRGEIVDQKTGYSFGNPITYEVASEEEVEDAKKIETLQERLTELKQVNNLAHLDTQTAKYSSICGTASRLLYLDAEKKIRIMHVDPWETIFITDRSIDKIMYVIRYYKMVDTTGTEPRTFTRVEWYDELQVLYFNEDENGEYEPDDEEAQKYHGFKMVPLVEFPNKEERLGDFQKVRELIDAYDLITSYNQDEMQYFRNAYLVFAGIKIDKEFIDKMTQLGGVELPENAKVDWLTKDINKDFVEMNLKYYKSNIYRFSKAVDMSDENFSGSGQSGESRKWKIKALSDDGIIKEREFEKSVRGMFEVISTMWDVFDVYFHYEYLKITFTNNLPVDLLYHADVQQKLSGQVSDRTRLSLAPFISDPLAEMDRIDNENAGLFETPEEDPDPDGDQGNE